MILLFRKERAVGDVWRLQCAEPLVLCSPWTLPKDFLEGLVAAFLLVDVFPDSVESENNERVEVVHMQSQNYVVVTLAVHWRVDTPER